MLTDEQIIEIRDKCLPSQGEQFDTLAYARAIESAVRAEYADVPPHRFKRLYRAANNWRNNDSMPNDICMALLIIDNGTYNPKIGG